MADVHGFSDCNLHEVHVIAIPNGFKQRIRKTENQDVLHGFFCQEMVDVEDLMLGQDAASRPPKTRSPRVALRTEQKGSSPLPTFGLDQSAIQFDYQRTDHGLDSTRVRMTVSLVNVR